MGGVELIQTRTPLRITFVGGGTDLPEYYQNNGGACINATIDKYVTVTVTDNPGYPRSLHSETIRAACDMMDLRDVQVEIEDDISTNGLGRSSAICVGLLKALHAHRGQYIDASSLAQLAYVLEREVLKRPGGKQDNYAAAFGGKRLYQFNVDESVTVNDFDAGPDDAFLLFDTNVFRVPAPKAHRHIDITKLALIHALVAPFTEAWMSQDVGWVGAILHQYWEMKQETSELITSDEINQIYNHARQAGAYGGKLLGGGGGGAMLLCVPEHAQTQCRNTMKRHGCSEIPFNFTEQGVICNHI